ncbi:MAG: glutamate formimidoyltransferase [Flavobacteriales bacterium]|mgnify:FL=1|jgi:glutamate formiminotransferase / formiminotetrahydrofolate cyclodeaminase|nr:glutamate formimidoyltransferase [Flavobacteriales bacterium]MBT4705230.1 glutamate formimidoyltransferase [Flavobacteriales bacterium]MBT4931325.1 glutamate formimidoyltransferase [Flavobacteriales bacterium]MBT5133010.1 glutamate formimidoyltransferase [Flavobacteriales bacterium]MBT5978066.1 glutamate formimidoyltransferase [Flavobacteriales bacterium]
MKRVIECVPNISEGRDKAKIKRITDIVEKVDGALLLNVDPGKATNRTVITIGGSPEDVMEAAFQLIKKASEEIDMSQHSGAHPRFGATDVCPLVPVSNVTMEECIEYARILGKRIGEELSIPVYFYENAATSSDRSNLATVRSGEYEGLKDKLSDSNWKPDHGPSAYNESVSRSGVTAVSARDFLVAYNINLNTTSTRRANSIAFDIRERGRVKREGNSLTGKIIKDNSGNPVSEPGLLKCVKGIGWFIEEYGVAQISYNLTNISVTSIHEAFDKTCERALARGIRVTGSELIGLVPKKALLEAGEYFLKKQERSLGLHEEEVLKIAVKSLGLDELAPFNVRERIIEYVLEDRLSDSSKLVDLNLKEFAHETAAESPAPGGGSISAYVGALGVSLGTMVANLSAHKRGWDDKWEYYSEWAVKGQQYKQRLTELVDEDTEAFNQIMAAFGLPKGSEAEKEARKQAISDATKGAILIPLEVMKNAADSMEVMLEMSQTGLEASISDAGVGALCARTAVRGAWLNVRINAKDLNDQSFIDDVMNEASAYMSKADELESKIIGFVEDKI